MKRYIMAMSIDRAEAKQRLTSYKGILMEHIIKLLVYSDVRPNDVHGWIHTLANWIHKCDSITIKPKNRKLSKSDIISSLFCRMGDEVGDYERELYAFIADNRYGRYNHGDAAPYPEFEVTDELCETFMQVCYKLIEETIPFLIDKQDHTIEEYEAVIQKIFDSLETC